MDDGERQSRASSFGAGAAAYERSRPGYPAAALDWLIPDGARRILDLGAGTGKLTRLLAERGYDLCAVDPSSDMLDQLRRRHPSIETKEGTAEAIPFPNAAFDAVLVAQAWHWFDAARATAEVARVLQPGGRIGLIWNARDTSIDWVRRFSITIDRGKPSYAGTPVTALAAPFGQVEAHDVTWRYRLDETSFIELAASRSAFLTMPATERDALLESVRALFDEVASASHGDPLLRTVELPYVTRCFRASRG